MLFSALTIIDEHTVVGKNAAGFCCLYVETSVLIALCETDSFRH